MDEKKPIFNGAAGEHRPVEPAGGGVEEEAQAQAVVQSPNSFMHVKCKACATITTVFSHSHTVVACTNCQTLLCQPTGGLARVPEGCSFVASPPHD